MSMITYLEGSLRHHCFLFRRAARHVVHLLCPHLPSRLRLLAHLLIHHPHPWSALPLPVYLRDQSVCGWCWQGKKQPRRPGYDYCCTLSVKFTGYAELQHTNPFRYPPDRLSVPAPRHSAETAPVHSKVVPPLLSPLPHTSTPFLAFPKPPQ